MSDLYAEQLEMQLRFVEEESQEREMVAYEQGKEDGVREFAEKIKSHMMMYCQGRLEQQYCALEVIDYIGKLMGEKDFSIDVEKEIAEYRAKTITELESRLLKIKYDNDAVCGFVSIDSILTMLEQMKEQK